MITLKTLQNRVDSLNLRERAMLLCGVLVIFYFLFDLFVMQPLEISQRRVQNALVQKNAEMIALNVQLQQIATTSGEDQQEQDRHELQRLRQELTALDQALKQATANLVPPQDMPKLLQRVLGQTDGLRLKKVTSLGSSPLVLGEPAVQDGEPGEAPAQPVAEVETSVVSTAYKHGLQIEFEGDFFNTLDYMRRLEDLEWNFFWDGIAFKVVEYPEATGTLSLFTISLNKDWIGV